MTTSTLDSAINFFGWVAAWNSSGWIWLFYFIIGVLLLVFAIVAWGTFVKYAKLAIAVIFILLLLAGIVGVHYANEIHATLEGVKQLQKDYVETTKKIDEVKSVYDSSTKKVVNTKSDANYWSRKLIGKSIF